MKPTHTVQRRAMKEYSCTMLISDLASEGMFTGFICKCFQKLPVMFTFRLATILTVPVYLLCNRVLTGSEHFIPRCIKADTSIETLTVSRSVEDTKRRFRESQRCLPFRLYSYHRRDNPHFNILGSNLFCYA